LSSPFKVALVGLVLVAGSALAQAPGQEETGRLKFNSNCGSCHGDDAVANDPKTNLRRMKARYPDTAEQVFEDTVKNGRPDQGMPSWSEALSSQDIAELKTFIFARQAPAAP
jgi:mono/diheme cytochrome c family protein